MVCHSSMKIFLNIWNMPKYFYVFPSPLKITNTYLVLGIIISILHVSTQPILPTTLWSRWQRISVLWMKHRNVKMPTEGNKSSECQSRNLKPGEHPNPLRTPPPCITSTLFVRWSSLLKHGCLLTRCHIFLFVDCFHVYLFHCLVPINVLKSLPSM